jgi:uroporphyrin-III C-methyltransferase
MPPALLTAVDSSGHVHLIVGSNPLAGARCARSLEVGAVAKLVAAEDAVVHYGLKKRAEDGQVQWIKREFQDDDLTTLGRAEVDHVVDAVFVTLSRTDPRSMNFSRMFLAVY